jgi:hypothetical protein
MLSFQAEFTARNTPQQNGLVEVKIATIAGRARAMCNAAHMNNETRHYIANKVLSHSTDLDNLLVDKLHTKTRYERFGLSVPKWAEMGQIKAFGEAGFVKSCKGSKLQPVPRSYPLHIELISSRRWKRTNDCSRKPKGVAWADMLGERPLEEEEEGPEAIRAV